MSANSVYYRHKQETQTMSSGSPENSATPKPSRTEKTYGKKNESYGMTYDEMDRLVKKDALDDFIREGINKLPPHDIPDGKTLGDYEQVRRNTYRKGLEEFQVKDKDMAHAMAEVEDEDRTRIAALNLIGNGIEAAASTVARSDFDRRRGSPLERTEVRSGIHTAADKIGDLPEGTVDRADSQFYNVHRRARLARDADRSIAEKIRGENKTTPVSARLTPAELQRQVSELRDEHRENAERLGEKAAKSYLKQQKRRS